MKFTIDKGMLIRPNEHLHVRLLIIMIILTLLVLVIFQGEMFLTSTNFQSMSFQSVELGILSLAMCIAILLAGIDLSIIAIANLSSIVVATYLKSLDVDVLSLNHIIISLLLMLLVGFFCGAINGILIGYLNVPAILATLATMTLYGGLAIGYTSGTSISGMPSGFDTLGNGVMYGIPIPLLIFIAVFIAIWWTFEKTSLGTYIYCIGLNPKASLYSGIPVTRVLLKSYILIGVLSAIAGVIILSRTNSANPSYGSSYILSTILIVALGGISVLGGKGKILGVVMAIILLQLFSTGLNMLLYKTSGSNFLKDVIWGGLLIIIILIMNYLQRKGRN